jgi:methionyl-tRNA formyltransferase
MKEETKPLDIVFFASGAFAAPIVRAVAGASVAHVLVLATKPDPLCGRGRKPAPCPAKVAALEAGVAVMDVPDVNAPEFVETVSAMRPDLFVVVDFGQFLRGPLLAVPKMGAVNVHPSLLPLWRGASPVQWALASGDETTGVSVLYVTPKMDAGDILSQETAEVLPDDTAGTLSPRLAEQGARQLIAVLEALRDGTARAVPQDDSRATFARLLKKEDGAVDWTRPAGEIYNRWRGFHPWPGAVSALPDGTPLKIHAMRIEALPGGSAEAGTVVACGGDGPLVACGDGMGVRLLSVQPAGKGAMAGSALVCGRRLKEGDRLR